MLTSARNIFSKKARTHKSLARLFAGAQDNFMNGTNSIYTEQMFDQWKQDRNSVHPSWNAYFTNITNGVDSEASFNLPPKGSAGPIPTGASGDKNSSSTVLLSFMIDQYRRLVHEIADVNPLKT